jgi:hypothetical protein
MRGHDVPETPEVFNGTVFAAGVPVDGLSFEGRIGYYSDPRFFLKFIVDDKALDVPTSVWDLSLAARVHPALFVTLEAGVRYVAAYLKTESNELRWSLGGLFVGYFARKFWCTAAASGAAFILRSRYS